MDSRDQSPQDDNKIDSEERRRVRDLEIEQDDLL